jgi:glycosyltransferase involved in cell wall biosynthesis
MRIALVCPRYAPDIGGVEAHVGALASRLAAGGWEPEVLAQRSTRGRGTRELVDGVPVRRYRTFGAESDFATAPALWADLRRRADSYDLIHAHGYHSTPAIGALGANAPLVFTPHYHGTGHSAAARLLHGPYRRIGSRIFTRARAIICVSEAEAKLVARDFPKSAGVLVIPNGVDRDAFRDVEPMALNDRTVLAVGRLEHYKGLDRAIGALAHLGAEFTLRIIGEGPYRPALEARAARLGIADRVRFLGRASDEELKRWYVTAAVVLALSEHEAFGLTLLEGVAAGTRVVASAIPAHRAVASMVGHHAISLVGEELGPQDVAATIAASAGAQVSQDAIAALPDWDNVTEQTMAVYRSVARARLATGDGEKAAELVDGG